MKSKQNIKIGNLKLKSRVFLAPMHQVNDIVFRVLCKKAGAGLVYTGLMNPLSKEPFNLGDKPAVQFACNTSKGIPEFIKKYDKDIKLYDFNLGCPSPHAKQSKVGYFMINNFDAIDNILKTIKKNTKKPLTLKIRKMPLEVTKKIITIANKYCDAIVVHPRTQGQGYSGEPDLEFARRIKKLTKLPLIYSGNIRNKQETNERLKEFDFIMIGRASFGNPNIFSELTNKKIRTEFNFKDWLKLTKKLEP
jgi:tRNA-dihydrouridine synthase B